MKSLPSALLTRRDEMMVCSLVWACKKFYYCWKENTAKEGFETSEEAFHFHSI
jgi:hypothetical protein